MWRFSRKARWAAAMLASGKMAETSGLISPRSM